MRWSAVTTVAEGVAVGLVDPAAADRLAGAAARRQADPAFLPGSAEDQEDDRELAAVAVGIALRRHAGRSQVVFGPDGRVVERSGKDLREVDLLVGSGGVLRHDPAGRPGAELVLRRHLAADAGWQLPESPQVVVDHDYVLAAAGLLVAEHPGAAYALVCSVRSSPGS